MGITVITETRDDAIGGTNRELVPRLCARDPRIRHIRLDNRRFRKKHLNTALTLWNTVKLAATLPREDVLLFTDPVTIKAIVALLRNNRKLLVVHHLPESDPPYYRWLPTVGLKLPPGSR